ncbi:hypothetical protein FD754_012063, partial [Muntiacus muntjak]
HLCSSVIVAYSFFVCVLSLSDFCLLITFCFDDLSIGVSRVLKSPAIIVLLSISPFMSVSVCLMVRFVLSEFVFPLMGKAECPAQGATVGWVMLGLVFKWFPSCNFSLFDTPRVSAPTPKAQGLIFGQEQRFHKWLVMALSEIKTNTPKRETKDEPQKMAVTKSAVFPLRRSLRSSSKISHLADNSKSNSAAVQLCGSLSILCLLRQLFCLFAFLFLGDSLDHYLLYNVMNLYSLNKIGSTLFPKTNPISSAKVIPYGVCGIPPFSLQWLSRRIAGGIEACPHCWPWQVGLRFLGNHQCGGVIINSIWILTAAHCVQSKNNPLFWTVVAGDHDRTLKESTEQVRRAKHIITHEDFDTRSYDSDIALIQLSSALEFNSVVRPVCLPHSLEPLFSSEICVVTGWGSVSKEGGLASRLQQIQVSMLEREVCERTYYSAHPGGISEKMICADFTASGGKDVGQGDSGGPLVCKHEKGPFVLYGIVSWGAGCGQPRKPGVFARVSVFLDWIQSKIKGPVLLQIKNESKILTRQQSSPIPSRESASGPGCYSEVELEEPRGFFSSPRYPLDYRGKLECSWVLRVSPSSMAKLTVEYLLLSGSHMCQDSALIIYEENHSERRMSGKLCGRRLYPMVFMSSGPLVRVTFHSSVRGAFGINYIVFRVQGPKGSKSTQSLQSSNQEHVATCEDAILTKPTGIIQFPRYFHRTTMSCHWRLLAPVNHIIRLDIINFQKQPMPLACQGHLWVYEGFGSGRKLIVTLARFFTWPHLTESEMTREKGNGNKLKNTRFERTKKYRKREKIALAMSVIIYNNNQLDFEKAKALD